MFNEGCTRLDPEFVRPIAHRGLHDISLGRIENSAPAFEAAIAAGFGIECDLRPASDGTPFVFHDRTLDRLVEASGPIAAYSPSQLSALRYRNQNTPLLRFADLLDLVAGKVPLLVEIKSDWDGPDSRFLEAVAELSLGYRGPLALMSFDPAVMVACVILRQGCRAASSPVPTRGRSGGRRLLIPNEPFASATVWRPDRHNQASSLTMLTICPRL